MGAINIIIRFENGGAVRKSISVLFGVTRRERREEERKIM